MLRQLSANLIGTDTALQHLDAIQNTEKDCFALCQSNADRCRGSQPVPPASSPPPVVDAEQVRSFSRAANSDAQWGVFLGLAATAATALGAPFLGFFLVGAAAGAAFSATINTGAGLDVDTAQITVPEPTSPIPPTMDESGPDADVAQAMNGMLVNQAQGLGYGVALMSALSRANGAAQTGQADLLARQLTAAHGFALQWADVLAVAGAARRTVAQLLEARGIATDGLPVGEILRLQAEVRSNGWPEPLQEALERYGITGGAKVEVLGRLTAHLNSAARLSAPLVEHIEGAYLVPYEEDLISALHRIPIG